MVNRSDHTVSDHETSDRMRPPSKQPWFMRMTWSEPLFPYWGTEPNLVADQPPVGVPFVTWDSRAWIGVVPFLISKIALRLCASIPGLSRFLEWNLPTYVTVSDRSGI